MVDDFKNLNLGDLMGKAREMQEGMARMQAEMAKKTITADAGGGMVQATVNGKFELVKLHIDPLKVDLKDIEMLEDVIIAAVNAAHARIGAMMQEDMRRQAQQMGLPPGMLPQ